jgi:ParB family chromosome partitioning protein
MNAVATAPIPRGTNAPPPVTTLDDVLLELIDIGDNVRVDAGELEELAASIAELGVLDPVKVTSQADGRYRLVWGQRRVLASRQAGKLRIPAIIEPAGAIDEKGGRRSIEQLTENLQRKDLNAIEEAVALREVLDADATLTQTELAKRLGRSAPWVSNTLRLLDTDPVIQEGVRVGTITASHAKALVVLEPKEQRRLAERIKTGLSSHQLENEISWKVQEAQQRNATAARTEKAVPKVIAALEAAAVPKAAKVRVQDAYNLDSKPIEAAIRKAGWTVTADYLVDRGQASKCDCTAVRVEFNRTWKVTPACSDTKHQDRQRNVDHQAWRTEQAARNAELEARGGAVASSLRDLALPPVLIRVLAWSFESWHQESWETRAAKPDDELLEFIGSAIALRTRNIDHDALMAALGFPVAVAEAAPAPAPTPAKGRKKAVATT